MVVVLLDRFVGCVRVSLGAPRLGWGQVGEHGANYR
jgi:hypothetical protein